MALLPKWIRRHSSSNDTDEEDTTLRPRSILRTRTMSTMNFHVDKTIGWKIRDFFGYLEKTLGPYLKKIFPNFVVVHYFYTISITIIGSILIYPVKNLAYIDALFFAACSATQAGLNTVDVNQITLYQQIVIYIVCCITTPIFIHGSLTFLRLYWFERYFDDIRETSKLNFKMRRTATLAARTQSMERQRTADSTAKKNNDRHTVTPHFHSSSAVLNEAIDESPESKMDDETSSSELNVTNPMKYTSSAAHLYNLRADHAQNSNGIEHISEPSDDDDDDEEVAPANRRPKFVVDDEDEETNANTSTNIKFAELPKPRRAEVEPRDVYMSISMLRNNQLQKPIVDDENEGPALVIKGPAEREAKKKNKSHRRKNSAIHFNIADKPTRPRYGRKRSGIRRSFIFNRHNESDDTRDDDDEEENDDDDNITGRESDEEGNDSGNPLERAQTHLQLPSSDQTGGTKFNKRSNTLDVPSSKGGFDPLRKSPTLERLFKQKLKRPSKQFRRRLSSSAITDGSSDYNSETDTDDESVDHHHDLHRLMSTSYLSWDPQIGRNSKFVNLSDQQKEELGGVEYRAIKLLATIVVVYYVGFHVIGFLFFVPWINTTKSYQNVILNNGVSINWWGFFTSMSAFNDLGYTLTADSMNSFNKSPFVLLVTAFFVIIGNTGFPILLRFIIWVLFKFSKELSLLQESLGFLLDHPRRCFTLLFPSAPTWWLLFILVALNVIDLILFIILDLGAAVLEGLTTGQKVLDGIFQAVSTRTAGFACVDLSQLHPSVQVSYMVMMYISVLPLAISIRRTNVYEEQSLGVYMGKGEENEPDHDKTKPASFIGAHLRKQLSFDLWFVFLGLFIICISEGGKLQNTDLPDFNIFRVMFEVVSAYGTVGLSLGYPNTTPSFSAQFNTLSKLVIIAMIIRGRMRGLPYSLDRSIILPSAQMDKFDMLQDLQNTKTLAHAETIGTVNDPVLEFFKSAAPNVIRKRFKRPSVFSRRSSTNYNRNSNSSGSSSQQQQGTNIPHHHHYDHSVNPHSASANIHFQRRPGEEEDEEDDNLNHIPTNVDSTKTNSPKFNSYQYNNGDFVPTELETTTGDISNNGHISPNEDEEYEMDYFNSRAPNTQLGSTTSL